MVLVRCSASAEARGDSVGNVFRAGLEGVRDVFGVAVLELHFEHRAIVRKVVAGEALDRTIVRRRENHRRLAERDGRAVIRATALAGRTVRFATLEDARMAAELPGEHFRQAAFGRRAVGMRTAP